jgi:hypothetical protein
MAWHEDVTETSPHGRLPLTLGTRLVVYGTVALAGWLAVAAAVIAVVTWA